MKMIYKAVECGIETSREMQTAVGDCGPETVSYAVRRMFVRSESLCREYVTMSYLMRLASGKDRRARRCKCVVPASLAELEGELLRIEFSVGCSGVTIQKVTPIPFSSAD